jgi:hypothetical protein
MADGRASVGDHNAPFPKVLCSDSLKQFALLLPGSISCGLSETFADISAAETDVFQFPVAELTEKDQLCLPCPARNFGSNDTVYKAAEPGQDTT